ncbi:unnamed protein product (macronuclear) [Paramecium tetraurelia]|uniref:Uncharacterized protein n=1 Tax=Paramecium tetraurelia TaxID=5888 RepID=A0DR34_PARTE|nr:uncharacterized protein GSPATT00002902001 [Paramecium tetraurelia]CAK85501.1 unnamed protein product [Paramecium tetraurelia]|eukprot:XP_001452898.1 hypothetical protein (macronuclear) [Paramecium tetraurelia strain d4-2]
MKGFLQKLMGQIKQEPNLTQAGQFFKKVSGTSSQKQNANNPHLIDRIDQLNRIIIQGYQRDFLMLRIRQVITEAQLGHNISPKVQDACEVVHYALLNNIPVLISKVKLVHPEFDLSDQIIVDEKEFEKRGEDANPELKSDIQVDTFANKDQSEYYDNQRNKWKEQQRKKR